MNLSTVCRQGAIVVGVTFVVAIGVYLAVFVSLVEISDHPENDALFNAAYPPWRSKQAAGPQDLNRRSQGSGVGTSPDIGGTGRHNDPARRVR